MTVAPLTPDKIRKIFGDTHFDRGMDYFLNNMIHSGIILDTGIKARCKGANAYSYYVEIIFDLKPQKQSSPFFYPVKTMRCSCPIGGHCKHAAALMLSWFFNTDSFQEQKFVAASLDKHTKKDLTALVLELIRKNIITIEQLNSVQTQLKKKTCIKVDITKKTKTRPKEKSKAQTA